METAAEKDARGAGPLFDNSYARLPEAFYARQAPMPAKEPRLLRINAPLAEALGFDIAAHSDEEWAGIFAGNRMLPGAEPLAMAYAGHQFGNLVPQLGDGRALLLGEVVDDAGVRRDIQLKGSGRTPFSRGGDGRSSLGPVLREYIVSEAMHAMGIPATRALAAVTTGESVMRDRILPGGVLTRVARSHIRVGTFVYFAVRGDTDNTRRLADYVIDRHFPELADSDAPYLALLGAVSDRQAALIAKWMAVGFIHGVMNTDNVAVSGETLDFGPCAFMDSYHPDKTFSSIDQLGRYAYSQQPRIGQWNLARLAECLLPLIDSDQDTAVTKATDTLDTFSTAMEACWLAEMRRKLGLEQPQENDKTLIQQLLAVMQQQEADFTLAFRALSTAAAEDEPIHSATLQAAFSDPSALAPWMQGWMQRRTSEGLSIDTVAARMHAANPCYIPRNHRIEQVIAAAVDDADFSPFARMTEVLQQPFTEQPGAAFFAEPPAADEIVSRTFCGT